MKTDALKTGIALREKWSASVQEVVTEQLPPIGGRNGQAIDRLAFGAATDP